MVLQTDEIKGGAKRGLTMFIDLLPQGLRRGLLLLSDILALALFAYLFWFGVGFAQGGATRQAMIFGMTLGPAYAAIPVSAGLAFHMPIETTGRQL